MPRYTYNGVTCTATRRRPSSRDDKKYMRTVTYQGSERLVHYGDPNMEMQRDRPDRREAFLTRHSCDTKKDPFASGFWSCYDWQNTDEKSADMKSITQPLKVVDSTDDTLTVEMYVAVFGDENNRDVDGEYFHTGTSFKSSYTDVNAVAVDWEHGQSPDVDEMGQKVEQPGRDDIVGVLDSLTIRNDGIGILARAALNRRDWYMREFVEPMIRIGMVGGSSEAIPGKVVKSGGRIDVWPLKRYALTLTPADTRQVTERQVYAIKALADTSPQFKSVASEYPILKALTTDGNNYTINVYPTKHMSINPTLQNDSSDWSAGTFVIPPGYPADTSKAQGEVIRVHSGDNVSIETKPKSEEAQAITAETQEGEQLQTGGAPVTATPEDETGIGGLTLGQETILLEQVEALLRIVKEMQL